MNESFKYIQQPFVLSIIGALIYYIVERCDCYINARKTSSLNRRTILVFIILIICLYIITIEENVEMQDVFTDAANF
jgi:hypothetical protein